MGPNRRCTMHDGMHPFQYIKCLSFEAIRFMRNFLILFVRLKLIKVSDFQFIQHSLYFAYNLSNSSELYGKCFCIRGTLVFMFIPSYIRITISISCSICENVSEFDGSIISFHRIVAAGYPNNIKFAFDDD